MSSRKRKFHFSEPAISLQQTSDHIWSKPDQADSDLRLSIQAYEAEVVRGPQAFAAAQSLETMRIEGEIKGPRWKVGDALIRWGGEGSMKRKRKSVEMTMFDAENVDDDTWVDDEEDALWVDRYDARLLLDTLPTAHSPRSMPGSPGGWSDLASDTEDTFFFTPDEAEDFRRDKRRRLIDRNREERLKARRAEDGDDENDEEEVWGGSDEDPNDIQKELMRRTAAHIQSSPNPAQLEMRILANHGGDKRFAFLRGRWARAWKTTKLKVRAEKEAEAQTKAGGGLGGLLGYGDSDGESEDGCPKELTLSESKEEEILDEVKSEDVVKEARRARAREWAKKRRAMNVGNN